MSVLPGLEADTAAPDPAPAGAPAKARDLVKALDRHYTGGENHRDADSHAVYTEVPHGPDGTGRRIEYLAVSLWGSRGVRLEGHEIKVSRADWLHELAQPSKADDWWRVCHRWWVVVPEADMVRDGELPDGWGLMVPQPGANRRSLRVVRDVPIRQPELPAWLLARLLLTDKRRQRGLIERAEVAASQRARDHEREQHRPGELTHEQRQDLDEMQYLRRLCERAGHPLVRGYRDGGVDVHELSEALAIAAARRAEPGNDRYTRQELERAAEQAETFAAAARHAADLQKAVTL